MTDAALSGNPSIHVKHCVARWQAARMDATTAAKHVPNVVEDCLRTEPYVHEAPFCVAFLTASLLQDVRRRMSKTLIGHWATVIVRVLSRAGLDETHPVLVDVMQQRLLGVGSHHLVLLPCDVEFLNTVELLRAVVRKAKKNVLLKDLMDSLERDIVVAYGDVPDPTKLSGTVRQRLMHIRTTIMPTIRLSWIHDVAERDANAVLERLKSSAASERSRKKLVSEADVETCLAALRQGGVSTEAVLSMAPLFLGYRVKAPALREFMDEYLQDAVHSSSSKKSCKQLCKLLSGHISSSSDAAYMCLRDLVHVRGGVAVDSIPEGATRTAFLAQLLKDPSAEGAEIVRRLVGTLDTAAWRELTWSTLEHGNKKAVMALRGSLNKDCPADVRCLLDGGDVQAHELFASQLMSGHPNDASTAHAWARSVALGCEYTSGLAEWFVQGFVQRFPHDAFIMEIVLNGVRGMPASKPSKLADTVLHAVMPLLVKRHLSTASDVSVAQCFQLVLELLPHSSASPDQGESHATSVCRALDEYSRSNAHLGAALRTTLWRSANQLMLLPRFRMLPCVYDVVRSIVGDQLRPLLGYTFAQAARACVQTMPLAAERLFRGVRGSEFESNGMCPTRMTGFFSWMEGLNFHKDSAAASSMGFTSWLLSIRNTDSVWTQSCAYAASQRPALLSMLFEALRMELLDTHARMNQQQQSGSAAPPSDALLCVAYVACQFAASTLRHTVPEIPPPIRAMIKCIAPYRGVLSQLTTPRSILMARYVNTFLSKMLGEATTLGDFEDDVPPQLMPEEDDQPDESSHHTEEEEERVSTVPTEENTESEAQSVQRSSTRETMSEEAARTSRGTRTTVSSVAEASALTASTRPSTNAPSSLNQFGDGMSAVVDATVGNDEEAEQSVAMTDEDSVLEPGNGEVLSGPEYDQRVSDPDALLLDAPRPTSSFVDDADHISTTSSNRLTSGDEITLSARVTNNTNLPAGLCLAQFSKYQNASSVLRDLVGESSALFGEAVQLTPRQTFGTIPGSANPFVAFVKRHCLKKQDPMSALRDIQPNVLDLSTVKAAPQPTPPRQKGLIPHATPAKTPAQAFATPISNVNRNKAPPCAVVEGGTCIGGGGGKMTPGARLLMLKRSAQTQNPTSALRDIGISQMNTKRLSTQKRANQQLQQQQH
eukprot:PhM_4_TR1966/c0_g1_i1/m.96268